MLGAIAGDIIGSVYETKNRKAKDIQLFGDRSRFTDDTVLTIATAEVILSRQSPALPDHTDSNYTEQYKHYFHRYPLAGFGKSFAAWAMANRTQPYNSWGNGSAMRVSPIGFAFDNLNYVLAEAERSAAVTHSHPEGIKGAQATAAVIFLARTGHSKADIKTYVQETFGYDLNRTVDEIRPTYQFDVSCQGSVPQAIMAFLESTDFEDAIRTAISIGGDSDTIACMAGGMADAFYGGVPDAIAHETWKRLDEPLTHITQRFITEVRGILI